MIVSFVRNKEMIDGDSVILPARLVEMSRLLSGLPSKAGFIGKQFPVIILLLVKSILITSDERLTEH